MSKITVSVLALFACATMPLFSGSPSSKKGDIEAPLALSPDQMSKAFTNVAKRATPAVVFIKVQSAVERDDNEGAPFGYQNPFDFFSDDFFHHFFGFSPKGQAQQRPVQMSQGSGFLVTSDGYIITNAHVVKGAEKISVTLHNGKELDASLIGLDSHTDIAVVKVEGKELPCLPLGDSEVMEIGEWVVAIGSPFQLEATVTAGIISAKGRQNLRITDLEDFIQTDAAINPGNSGGPLLNLKGEVIGINTAIFSRSGGYMGIGFAIPSGMARPIMHQIIDTGTVTRGFLGVSLQPVDKDLAEAFNLDRAEGALVADVLKGSPADRAGLKQGDIILEYNNTPVKTLGTFRNEIFLMHPGSQITLTVNRKGQVISLAVTLGTSSDEAVAQGESLSRFGIEVENITRELARQFNLPKGEEGIVITRIKPGSPAAEAGLRPGFVVLAVNHRKVTSIDEFNDAIGDTSKKGRLLLLVHQGNMTRFYSIKLD